jgi:hypothetical protein
MEFNEGQIHHLNALILKKHAVIVSGAYKSRSVYHGTKVDEDAKLTEEELLQNELAAMDQQIRWLDECVQGLAKKD